MKKWIAMLLALACVFGLAACGSQKEKNTAKERDFEKLYAQMEGTLPEMTAFDEKTMGDFYGVTADLYTQAKVMVAADGLLADEIWLIRAKDEAALKQLKTLAENRMTAKDEESVTYSPEQNKIVKQGKILTDGLDLALLVSPDVEALAKIFQ